MKTLISILIALFVNSVLFANKAKITDLSDNIALLEFEVLPENLVQGDEVSIIFNNGYTLDVLVSNVDLKSSQLAVIVDDSVDLQVGIYVEVVAYTKSAPSKVEVEQVQKELTPADEPNEIKEQVEQEVTEQLDGFLSNPNNTLGFTYTNILQIFDRKLSGSEIFFTGSIRNLNIEVNPENENSSSKKYKYLYSDVGLTALSLIKGPWYLYTTLNRNDTQLSFHKNDSENQYADSLRQNIIIGPVYNLNDQFLMSFGYELIYKKISDAIKENEIFNYTYDKLHFSLEYDLTKYKIGFAYSSKFEAELQKIITDNGIENKIRASKVTEPARFRLYLNYVYDDKNTLITLIEFIDHLGLNISKEDQKLNSMEYSLRYEYLVKNSLKLNVNYKYSTESAQYLDINPQSISRHDFAIGVDFSSKINLDFGLLLQKSINSKEYEYTLDSSKQLSGKVKYDSFESSLFIRSVF